MRLFMSAFLLFLGSYAQASESIETCSAPSTAEFQKWQTRLSSDIYGPEAEFDFTSNPRLHSEWRDLPSPEHRGQWKPRVL